MIHFLMTTDPHPHRLFQCECFLKSLDFFGKIDYKFTLVLTSSKHNNNKKIKLISSKTGNPYIDKRGEILFSDCHYSQHPPVRWHVEPKSDMCVFVDSDILVCSKIEVPDKNFFHGMLAHDVPCNLLTWENFFQACDIPIPSFQYQSLNRKEAMPYYVNFGVLFVPAKYMEPIKGVLPDLITYCNTYNLKNGTYFASQVALSLALEKLQIPKKTLSLRYNYPDHPCYDHRHPEEMKKIIFFHYLAAKHHFMTRQTARAFVNSGGTTKSLGVMKRVVKASLFRELKVL